MVLFFMISDYQLKSKADADTVEHFHKSLIVMFCHIITGHFQNSNEIDNQIRNMGT